MIHTTLAERWEAEWIASRLRSEDVAEVVAASGRSPEEIVPLSFDSSTQCYMIRPATPLQVSEHPVAIFGVGDDPNVEGLGVVWLLATPEVTRVSKSILASASHFLNAMSRDYPLGLHNFVDDRNRAHLYWCRAVGLLKRGTVVHNGFLFNHVHRPRPEEVFNV